MENPLHEAHEQIEQLDEKPNSRIKIVITVMILVVTMLTTGAGVLAAMWSAKQSETQRARQQAATQSLQEAVTANTRLRSVDELNDDVKQATWRKTFLHAYALELSDHTLESQVQQQADSAAAVAKEIGTRLPSGANSPTYTDTLYEPALSASEQAAAYARESAGWLQKNNGALAVVSMLALALFLLGLALTIGNRTTQIGFTALAIVMTVVAGARLFVVQVSDIAAPTQGCIHTASGADADLILTHYQDAANKLKQAVHDCPEYGGAWSKLATTYFYYGVVSGSRVAKSAWLQAELADQKALDVADVRSGELYNDLAYMQVLNHHYDAAAANLAQAHTLSPESHYVLGTLAELAIARGDVRTAQEYLKDAALSLRDAGPYFRDSYFFTSLRYDSGDFAMAGINGPKVQAFFKLAHEYEAVLDVKHMASPLDTHGASITNLIFKKSNSVLGRTAGFVTIGFDYHGLRPGDVLSLRFYGNNDTALDETASLTDTVATGSSLVGDGTEPPDTDYRVKLTYQYSTAMEVYLNGVYQGQVSYTP